MRHTLLPTMLLLFVILAAATPRKVLAQSTEVGAELVACLDIEPDLARLACLEAIAVRARESMAAATSNTPASVAPPSSPASPTAQAARAARTVAEPPARDDSDRTAAEEEASARSIIIAGAYELARGNMRFLTDDGEVFVQIDGPLRRRYPPVPFSAEIVEASMGSFFLRVEGGPRGVRVRRDDN